MCKILGFIKVKRKTKTDEQIDEIQRKTKTDEQIDEIQGSIADRLTLIASKMERALSRIMQIIDLNGGKPVLIKRAVTQLLLLVDDIKNLASDLRADARL